MDKLADEISCNKLCVGLIGSYKILMRWEKTLILKDVTIINPVTCLFGVTQYKD